MTTIPITPAKKVRLYEFDMLKGVAIFMVVMGHVLTMCVREIDHAPLFKLIEKIHMPLFFFISGWFTFKLTADGAVKCPDMLSRARQLLLPMVVVSSIWVWYFPHTGIESPLDSTFAGLWSDTWKNGYWFTLSLFLLIALYALLTPLLSRMRSASSGAALTVAVWAVLILINFTAPAKWLAYASFPQAATYFPAFMLGVLGRRHREGFMKIVNSSVAQTVLLLAGGICVFLLYWRWKYGVSDLGDMLLRGVFHVCLAPVAMAVFGPWARKAYSADAPASATLMPRIWTLLGKESLGIYLLHYFFLFPLGAVAREWLKSMAVGFVPTLVFSATVSAVVIACVLGLIKLIEPSRLITLLLTGKYEKSK
ncbi:MAG: acyltransferase family protein [Muribaculaceae bacterium]|nr:acyltransferase family protein [Muribaculaceae bacterium]